MEKFEKQGGISFLMIYFSGRDVLYYMQFKEMKKFWDRALNGGRKSFRIEELRPEYFVSWKQGAFIPYLNYIQMDLDEREEKATGD